MNTRGSGSVIFSLLWACTHLLRVVQQAVEPSHDLVQVASRGEDRLVGEQTQHKVGAVGDRRQCGGCVNLRQRQGRVRARMCMVKRNRRKGMASYRSTMLSRK